MTGHDFGAITISLAEADDVTRERNRVFLGETYRTLLGHFRHEIARYSGTKSCAMAAASRAVEPSSAMTAKIIAQLFSGTIRNIKPPSGRTVSSAHMLARILGRISPKLLRTVSISSTHWRHSGAPSDR
jgi:Putative zinc-binding metallo-peptidase